METIKQHELKHQEKGAIPDGVITIEYLEIVKIAGHSCATVAGAYLCTLQELRALYGDELPRRGEIRASFPDRFQEMVETVFTHADEPIDVHPLPKVS